jgi:histidinol phosphatase-like enzyme
MPGRYFGGQYDSVKQAAYLDYVVNGKKHKGKLPYQVILDHYTARLRLDILLGGSIILTDAMFFDGAYFQALFLHQEKREDFVNFLRLLSIGGIPPLIEIRQRRKTVEETLKTMIYKKGVKDGFIFSSLSSDYLKSTAAKVLSTAQNSDQDFSSWKEFIKNSLDYAEEEIVKDALEQKMETLCYMEELPANIFRTWDGTYDFQKVLNDAQAAERFRIIRTGEPVIDSVIASIEKEIKKPFPNRSKLQDEIARKTRILSRPPTIEAEQRLERLWGQFLQVYNRTIGIQHYCDSFDIGEIPISNEQAGTIIIENLSQATLQALARESWTAFGERYNNLSKYREKWIDEVWQLEEKKKESNKDARKALDNLIKQILREYRVRPSFKDVVDIVGGGASIDLDLMNANGISLGVSTTLLNIPVQTIDLAKKQWTYQRDKANLTEYGQNFEKGL